MNTLEHAQLINVLRQSGSYNDAEPLYASVRRLMDERDSERARANRLKVMVEETSLTATASADRVRALEKEITRLSIRPGSPVWYDARWSWVGGTAKAVPPPPPASESTAVSDAPAQSDVDRSRMGRQRRELRRLNAAQRVLRMEVDLATRKNEETVEEVVRLRRQLRVLETSK